MILLAWLLKVCLTGKTCENGDLERGREAGETSGGYRLACMVAKLIHGHPNSVSVRERSIQQAERLDADVLEEYTSRWREALDWPGLNPVAFPGFRGQGGQTPGWFDPARVLVERTTTLHHTDQEVLDFAIRNRGNHAIHLQSMQDLWLDEYPVPAGCEPLFKISNNGHHRRLVFHIVGYSLVAGNIQRCGPGIWTVSREQARWLRLFEVAGLADVESDGPSYFRISDATSVTGWVLPPASTTLTDVPRVVVERLAMLESAVGTIADSRVNTIRTEEAVLYHLKRAIPHYRTERVLQAVTHWFRRG